MNIEKTIERLKASKAVHDARPKQFTTTNISRDKFDLSKFHAAIHAVATAHGLETRTGQVEIEHSRGTVEVSVQIYMPVKLVKIGRRLLESRQSYTMARVVVYKNTKDNQLTIVWDRIDPIQF